MAARVQEKADMFSRMVRNGSLRLVCWVVMFSLTPAVAWAQNHPKDTEWPSYAADTAGTRYRPLDQINASNFSDLEIAWRIKTRSEEHTSELQSQSNLVCRLLLEKKNKKNTITEADIDIVCY